MAATLETATPSSERSDVCARSLLMTSARLQPIQSLVTYSAPKGQGKGLADVRILDIAYCTRLVRGLRIRLVAKVLVGVYFTSNCFCSNVLQQRDNIGKSFLVLR